MTTDTPPLYGPRGDPLPRTDTALKADVYTSVDLPLGLDQPGDTIAHDGPYADKRTYYDLHQQHPAANAAIELIVQSASRRPPLYSDPEHGKVPALEAFFAEINDEQDFQTLSAELYRDIAIAAEAFALKVRSGQRQSKSYPGRATVGLRTGRVVAIERLPGDVTICVPDRKTRLPDHIAMKVSDTGRTRKFALDDVIFWRYPANPRDRCRGMSPLEPLSLSLATDIQAAKAWFNLFANGLHHNDIFALEQGTPEQAERIKQWLTNEYAGVQNFAKAMLLLGNVKYIGPTDRGHGDLPFMNAREYAIREVMAVESIPHSKLYPDLKGGLGQARAETDDITFQSDNIAPLQAAYVAGWNRKLLVKEFGIDQRQLRLMAPTVELARYDRMQTAELATHCGLTGNQILTGILNMPRSDAPGMDEPMFLDRGVTFASSLAGEATVPDEESVDDLAQDDEPDNEGAATKPERQPTAAQAQTGMAHGGPARKAARFPFLGFARKAGPDDEPRRKHKHVAALIALGGLLDRRAAGEATPREIQRAIGGLHTADRSLARDAATRIAAIHAKAAGGEISDAQARQQARYVAGEVHHAGQKAKVRRLADESDPLMRWDEDGGAQHCAGCPTHFGEVRRASAWDVYPGDEECGGGCRCELNEV